MSNFPLTRGLLGALGCLAVVAVILIVVVRNGALHQPDVQVQSEELDTVPSELAAERFHSIDLPEFPEGSVGHREMVNQQQEQLIVAQVLDKNREATGRISIS